MKINKSDLALLQTRHFYNKAKIVKNSYGGGFTAGSNTLTIEVNSNAWGVFEQSILKAFKERQDLIDFYPDLVEKDKDCPKCNGVGGFPVPQGTVEFDKMYQSFYEDCDGKLEEDAPPKNECEFIKFCSPCQGTGIVLKNKPAYE